MLSAPPAEHGWYAGNHGAIAGEVVIQLKEGHRHQGVVLRHLATQIARHSTGARQGMAQDTSELATAPKHPSSHTVQFPEFIARLTAQTCTTPHNFKYPSGVGTSLALLSSMQLCTQPRTDLLVRGNPGPKTYTQTYSQSILTLVANMSQRVCTTSAAHCAQPPTSHQTLPPYPTTLQPLSSHPEVAVLWQLHHEDLFDLLGPRDVWGRVGVEHGVEVGPDPAADALSNIPRALQEL